MNIEQLKNEIATLQEDEQRYEALSQAKTECFKRVMATKQRLAELFVNNQMPSIEIDGNTVKAGFNQRFNIKGGKLKDPEKREQVINSLIEFGLLDEDKVETYTATEVNEATLQAALRKVPFETQQVWIERDLISITPEPSVTIKPVKKKDAAA